MKNMGIVVLLISGCTTHNPFPIHEVSAGMFYSLGNSTANTALFGRGENTTGKHLNNSSSWSHSNGDHQSVGFWVSATHYTDANPMHEMVNLMRLKQLRQDKPKEEDKPKGHTHGKAD